MKRSMFALAAALLFAGVAQAADFTLGFSTCPAQFKGPAGTPVVIPVEVTLTSANIPPNAPPNEAVKPDGVQGWSWSLRVTNGTVDPASFKPVDPESDPPDIYGLNLQVSTRYDSDGDGDELTTPIPGTPLKDPHMLYLFKAGFLVFENAYVTQKPDRPVGEAPVGAVCAIVLHQTKKMVLQPDGTQVIAKFNVNATIGDEPKDVVLAFEDGLFGAGEAVANVVTYNSTSNTPVRQTCTVPLRAPGQEFQLGIVAAGATDLGGEVDGDNIIEVTAVAGEAGKVSLDLLLKTANLPLAADDVEPADGPQGWSVGLRHDADLALATTDYVDIEGSPATGPEIYPPIPGVTKVSALYDNDADGGPLATPPGTPDIVKLQDLATAGFVVSEKAYVTAKATRPVEELPVGVVSAIVLHQTKKMVLHANATDPILRMVLTLPVVAAGETKECKIWIENDLFGSGEAVKNVITYGSASKQATLKRNAIIRVTGEVPVRANKFVRGDANNDGKIDIADAVWIVYTVVPGIAPGYSIPCVDSGDLNDDEALNIADAAFLIQYEFQGGTPPAAPLTECGTDDDSTEVTCPAASTLCGPAS
jgi:hypothetical protein